MPNYFYKSKKYIALGFVFLLLACKPVLKTEKVEGSLISVENQKISKQYSELLQPYEVKVHSEMNQVIGYSKQTLDKGTPEGLLGNFVADLMLEVAAKYTTQTKPDFCIINNGGLRNIIPKGDVTLGNIYEIMPFENKMVIITLNGESLKKMFEYVAHKSGVPISGFRIAVEQNKKYKVTVNNKEIDFTKNYNIVTSDYLADGGNDMNFFADSLKKEILGIKVRDAIIEHIKNLNSQGLSINPSLDNRIKYAK